MFSLAPDVHHYSSIYGLRIRFNERIPGVSSEILRDVDVDVVFGSMPSWYDSILSSRHPWYVSPQEANKIPRLMIWQVGDGDYFNVRYADGTEFLVHKLGSKIWATWPAESLSLEDTATYLLGPILGFVLLLRGHICLHASAIVIGDQAIALLGPAGSGKSTTAAAFAEAGYRILAEDVVTLDEDGAGYQVIPAYPCIRLWPASVEALYGPDTELPKLTPTWDKCYLDLTQQRYEFQNEPMPLGAIYLLDDRADGPTFPSIQEMSEQETMMSLIGNTYATYLLDKAMRAREFNLLTELYKNMPVKKVTPHTDPANIASLCRVIVEDFEALKLRRVEAPATQEHFLNV